MSPRDEKCDLCNEKGGPASELVLRSRCHLTAPLAVKLVDGKTLVLSCYVPECGREVARFEIARPV